MLQKKNIMQNNTVIATSISVYGTRQIEPTGKALVELSRTASIVQPNHFYQLHTLDISIKEK